MYASKKEVTQSVSTLCNDIATQEIDKPLYIQLITPEHITNVIVPN